MVVLQVNKFFFEKGGSERYFFALSRALEERGHSVVHFSMAHPRNHPSPFSTHFVSQRDYDGSAAAWESLRSAASFVRSREASKKLASLLAAFPPDVAHLHNIYHQLTPSVIEVLAARRIPVVMTLHDYKLVCPNYSLFAHGAFCYRCEGGSFYHAVTTRCAGGVVRSGMLAAESYWQRLTHVYDRVHRFLAPSRYLRSIMVRAGFGEERVLHLPGFVPPAEAPKPLGSDDHKRLDSLPARFVLYFGRLSPEKGIGTLVDAMAQAPDVPLVVCGDGPEAEALRRRAERSGPARVYFTGFAGRALLDALLGRAAVSVLPTLSPENAPLSILESAAAGVPVIVSDTGGLPELAAVVRGRVFPCGDATALARAVRDVWEDPAAARARAQEGRKAALAHFDRERHVQALERIYREAT